MSRKSTAIVYRDGARVPSRPTPDIPTNPINPDGQFGGVGITLNRSVIGGVKVLIEENDVLDIPENWEYNVTRLQVDGEIDMNGDINIG